MNAAVHAPSVEEFSYEIAVRGFVLFPAVLPMALLEGLRHDVLSCQETCRDWQQKNGLEKGMEGAAHHIAGGGRHLDEFLFALPLHEHIYAYFGSEYILNSFGAVNNAVFSAETYKHGLRFHRDVRTYSGDFRLMLNMLVMVDAFTVENGATRLVPGSHRVAARPTEEYLERQAQRVVGPAGSIVLFDSNTWHAAAPNTTGAARMALTLTFSRPFFKQQMDYPRLLGEHFPPNERARQLLGYNARVPSSYDEWYQPPEKRMYKPGQG